MRVARKAAALPLSVAVLALAGCPQEIYGPDDDAAGADGGGAASDGGAAPDGGGARDGGAADGGAGGLEVSCARQGTGPVVAGVGVEIRCTSTPAAAGWTFSADPAYATFNDQLASAGRLWVSFRAASLPAWFADTAVRVTIRASAGASSGEAAVEVPVVGNVLAAVAPQYDGTGGGIAAYRSDGTRGSDFAGPATIANATMLLRLRDGRVLAGRSADGTAPALQVFDARGVLERAFEASDGAANELFPSGTAPWGAAQEADGTVWVSMYRDKWSDGALHRFTPQGVWLSTVARPAGYPAGSDWIPLGIGVLADGTVAVATSDNSFSAPRLALYKADGTTQFVTLSFQVCDAGPTCRDAVGDNGGRAQGILVSGDEVILSLDRSDSAVLAAYSNPGLAFLRSTQHRYTGGYGWLNYTFGSVVRAGPVLVVGRPPGGCPLAVDPATLYRPADWPDQTFGCWAASGPTLRGLVRLGP